MKTEAIGELVKALAKAKSEIKAPTKAHTAEIPTKAGGKYTFAYADRADLIEAYKGPLCANGLVIIHTVRISKGGTPRLVSLLVHESGQSIRSSMPLPSVQDARTFASWLTHLERYQACALLDIAAEDDDGGANAVSKAKKDKPAGPAAPEAPPTYECITAEMISNIQAAAKRVNITTPALLRPHLLRFAGTEDARRIPIEKYEHVIEQLALLGAK